MPLIGMVFQLAYRLSRHLWLGWSLARWLGFLLAVAALAAFLRSPGRPASALALAGLLAIYLLLLGWAARRRYIHFTSDLQAASDLASALDPPLRTEELIPIRASGHFTVEGRDRYFVDLDADFETVGSREHIVLARVVPSRFLLLGQWPGDELGWWYIFFQPAMMRRLTAGTVHFGARARQALALLYSSDGETEEMVYLTFEDWIAMRRVWHDLVRDGYPADPPPSRTP